MTRAIPPIAVKFLEREEGVKFVGYPDIHGVPTAGMGHTGPGVVVGQTYTQFQIDTWAAADMQTAATRLLWAIGQPAIDAFNDYQYSALLSFVFNEGEKASWTIWADIRRGDLVDVPSELLQFHFAGGQDSPGLLNRRKAECALWAGTDPLCAHYPLSV